ncbi:MAG: LIC_10190 family membrane protein [Adhaeribacter sp.]
MISTFFAWLYIFLLTTGLGALLTVATARLRPLAGPSLPLYLLSLLGFAVLTAFLGIYSLVAPLGAWPHLLLITLVAAGTWRWPAPWQAAWHTIRTFPRHPLLAGVLLGSFFAGLLLYWTTTLPTNDDTGFYHSQTIKWLEQYAVVPGLGNLHGRLAFNSSFLQWSAFFSLSFLTGQPLFPLNGYFFLLLLAAWLPPLLRDFPRPRPAALLTGLLFVLHLDFFPSWISSPSPDIGGMLLLVGICHLAATSAGNKNTGDFQTGDFHIFALLLLGFTALTVKLSTLPIVALAPALWLSRGKPFTGKALAAAAALGVLMLAPWLIRNLVQTGYLIYPLPGTAIWELDWQVPLAAVTEEKNLIHSSAIRIGAPWQQVLALSFGEWFPGWFRGHSWFYQFLLVAAAASPLPMAAYLGVPGRAYPTGPQRRQQVLLWGVYYAGFLFWFTQAPSIRFGSAFLYVSALLPVYLWLLPLLKRYSTGLALLMLALVTLQGLQLLRDPVYLLRNSPGVLAQRLWLAEAQPPPALRPVAIPGGRVWVAERVQCWYGALPCTWQVPAGLSFRGASLAEGFRIEKKARPQEK